MAAAAARYYFTCTSKREYRGFAGYHVPQYEYEFTALPDSATLASALNGTLRLTSLHPDDYDVGAVYLLDLTPGHHVTSLPSSSG